MPADIGARLLVLPRAVADATRRFPVAVAGCLLSSLATLLLLHDIPLVVGRAPLAEWSVRIGIGLALGGFNAALLAEARSWRRALGLCAALLAGIAVAAHLTWLGTPWTRSLLTLGLALGCLGLPSLAARQDDDSAWAYAAGVVGQLGFAFGAAAVVDLGLWILFLLVRALLGVELPLRLPLDIAIVAFGVLAPLLLFGRIDRPAGFGAPAEMPPWLQRFMAWICVPLALAYLTVFELYILRIAIAWDLPDGRLAWLTIGIVGLGVLAHMLAYPCREQGPAWVRFYYRIFFPALIPVLALFGLSVWVRIDAYGLTEARYVLCLLLLWLGLIAAMAMVGRYRPVLVAALLTVLLILGSVGPWSATSLAVHSQLGRLAELLAEAGALKDGKLTGTAAAGRTGGPETTEDVASIVRFLVDREAEGRLAALFATPPDWASGQPATQKSRRKLAAMILADLGVANEKSERSGRFVVRGFGTGMELDIASYDALAWLRADHQGVDPPAIETAAGRFGFALDTEGQALVVTPPEGGPVRLDLGVLARRWRTRSPSTLADAMVERRVGSHRVRLVVSRLQGTWRAQADAFEPRVLEGLVLIR